MGLLDEAIREHLELKRRRGADTAEVARQEQEAFGPPQRGDFPAAEEPVSAPSDPSPFLADAPTSLHVVEEPAPPEPVLREVEPEPVPEPPRAEAPLAPLPVREELPEPEHDPERPEADQATRAFDAEEVRAATLPPPVAAPEPEPVAPPPPPPSASEDPVDPGEPEDVLEETPEFLQETPEHDRLWFEQRPPRDFDF